MKLNNIIAIGFALLTISCATSPSLNSFDQTVSLGMDKDQVLNEAGTPNLTKRRNGMDIWQFYFYDGEKRTIKEAHFKDGKVIYRGPVVLPKSNETAKAIDERNSRANATNPASGITTSDLPPSSNTVNRMKQELESELSDKKSNYQELE